MFLPLPVCVKSSEVLVSLVSCTVDTESVLNDRVSRCLLRHVRLVLLCSVYVLQRRSPARATAIRLACSVSNMTRLLWSEHVSTLYRILTSSFCRLTLYGLSLLVRTRTAQCLTEQIDNGTPAVLSARAHLIDVIFGDYSL